MTREVFRVIVLFVVAVIIFSGYKWYQLTSKNKALSEENNRLKMQQHLPKA